MPGKKPEDQGNQEKFYQVVTTTGGCLTFKGLLGPVLGPCTVAKSRGREDRVKIRGFTAFTKMPVRALC